MRLSSTLGPSGAGAATRVAALYDVHGNLPALEAVLSEPDVRRADVVLVGGDLVWGPLPGETLARLVALGERALFVRGNADREVAAGISDPLDPEVTEVTMWARARLTPPQREWLARLPLTVTLDVAGLGPTLFCHASPRRDDEAIGRATPDEAAAQMLDTVSEGTIVCGHTHVAFERRVAGRRVVNPGSVGLPRGPRGAHWAMLGPDVELRRSDYDVAAAGDAFVRKGGPGAGAFAAHVLDPSRPRASGG